MDLSSKSISELVHLASDSTVNGPGKSFWDETEEAPVTMLLEPASEEAIAELEQRIGTTLPNDYKDFLRTSNGMGNDWGSMIDGNGIIAAPELFAADAVEWDDEEYVQLPLELLKLPYDITDLTATTPDEADGNSFGFETAVPLLDRVLPIGSTDIFNLWLIHPDTVRRTLAAYDTLYEAANEDQRRVIDEAVAKFAGSWAEFKAIDWVCVTWESGGIAEFASYKSFGSCLKALVAKAMEEKND